MSELFLKIINMSISAGWLILAVLILRLVLKKAPKWVNVVLWGIVAVRLLFPFSIESALSLIPSAETVSPEIMMDAAPRVNTGVPAINGVVNPVIGRSFAPSPGSSANPLQIWIPVLATVWVVGVVCFLAYTAATYWRLRRRIGTAVLLRDNILQSENVSSPFVLGVIKPRIYLPFQMDGQDLEHVVAHERAHIRRRDHWWKPLGFLLLAIHWFNPLMWLAYVLLCRDIELACDEKVIRGLDSEHRADYSQALLACSVNRRVIAACPLAFGEVGVKDRVKSVMNYRKSAFWVIALAAAVCAVAAVCFLTDPVTSVRNPWVQEYVPGTGNILGGVDKERFERISEDFSIGADQYGRAVFKEPYQAFDTFVLLYADGIALIRKEFHLLPISRRFYAPYMLYGWQTTSGSEAARAEAQFVSSFLDIYENSFSKDIPLPAAPPANFDNEIEMVPTTANVQGAFGEYLYVPLGDGTYRYERSEKDSSSVTPGELLYRFTEKSDPFDVAWRVYEINESPEHRIVYAAAGDEIWLYQYSPPKRADANALSEAKASGCIIVADGDSTWGAEQWEAFYEMTQNGKPGSVKVAHYNTLDPERTDATAYEVYKEDYPSMFVIDLAYDGKAFTINWTEQDTSYLRQYKYLMKYEDTIPARLSAQTRAITRYVLTNDNTVTWDELFRGAASSRFGDYIDYFSIYSDIDGVGGKVTAGVFDKYTLTIGADGVASIELSAPNADGRQHADGSVFKKGERVRLEQLDGLPDLRGVSITALSEDGGIVWAASIPEENRGFTHLAQDGWSITNIG